MGVSATVDGLATFARTVDDAAAQLADLDQVNADAGAQVVQAVEAPRVTGRLAEGVTAIATSEGFTLTVVGAARPYAGVVHARNPFLTRALDQRESAVLDAYEQHVTDTVNTIQGA